MQHLVLCRSACSNGHDHSADEHAARQQVDCAGSGRSDPRATLRARAKGHPYRSGVLAACILAARNLRSLHPFISAMPKVESVGLQFTFSFFISGHACLGFILVLRGCACAAERVALRTLAAARLCCWRVWARRRPPLWRRACGLSARLASRTRPHTIANSKQIRRFVRHEKRSVSNSSRRARQMTLWVPCCVCAVAKGVKTNASRLRNKVRGIELGIVHMLGIVPVPVGAQHRNFL